MKPRLIALNLLLAAALAGIVWQGRVRSEQARAERKAVLNVPVRKVQPPSVPAVPKPDAPAAVKYADVATKNLFAADRNPNVIIDPPPVVKEKPMPHLPVVYGTMGLPSGIKAIMAEKPGQQGKSVRTGDTIGDFKVLALDAQKVTFEWEGKQVQKPIEELIDRAGPATDNRGPAAAPAGASTGPAAPPAPNQAQPPANAAGKPGADLSPTERACTGDNSPLGTVVDGYKKQFIPSPFGAINCHWVKQ